jgi:hypothetical protein
MTTVKCDKCGLVFNFEHAGETVGWQHWDSGRCGGTLHRHEPIELSQFARDLRDRELLRQLRADPKLSALQAAILGSCATASEEEQYAWNKLWWLLSSEGPL